MELINRRTRVYGPAPAGYNELRLRLCPGQGLEPPPIASEQEFNIAASYGPSPWNQQHTCTLGGVEITKTSIRAGDKHVWCQFPGGHIQVVREARITTRKISGYTGVKLNGASPQQ